MLDDANRAVLNDRMPRRGQGRKADPKSITFKDVLIPNIDEYRDIIKDIRDGKITDIEEIGALLRSIEVDSSILPDDLQEEAEELQSAVSELREQYGIVINLDDYREGLVDPKLKAELESSINPIEAVYAKAEKLIERGELPPEKAPKREESIDDVSPGPPKKVKVETQKIEVEVSAPKVEVEVSAPKVEVVSTPKAEVEVSKENKALAKREPPKLPIDDEIQTINFDPTAREPDRPVYLVEYEVPDNVARTKGFLGNAGGFVRSTLVGGDAKPYKEDITLNYNRVDSIKDIESINAPKTHTFSTRFMGLLTTFAPAAGLIVAALGLELMRVKYPTEYNIFIWIFYGALFVSAGELIYTLIKKHNHPFSSIGFGLIMELGAIICHKAATSKAVSDEYTVYWYVGMCICILFNPIIRVSHAWDRLATAKTFEKDLENEADQARLINKARRKARLNKQLNELRGELSQEELNELKKELEGAKS